MSLEHEMDVKPGEISGNFIISGEYKSHEVSVNREPFLHKLPFAIELTDNIDLDSIEFEITDFSYDILNDDTIEVSIEFSLEALEMSVEEQEEVKEERNLFEQPEEAVVVEELSELIDDTSLVGNEEKNETEILPDEQKQEEKIEEVLEKEEIKEERNEMIEEQVKTVEKIEDMKESEETIINNVNPMDDSYATYHIHIVKEGENIETICTMYHSNLNLLNEYNSMENMNIGDKIIIPKEDE